MIRLASTQVREGILLETAEGDLSRRTLFPRRPSPLCPSAARGHDATHALRRGLDDRPGSRGADEDLDEIALGGQSQGCLFFLIAPFQSGNDTCPETAAADPLRGSRSMRLHSDCQRCQHYRNDKLVESIHGHLLTGPHGRAICLSPSVGHFNPFI